ncbi:MAG: glycosyltransferase family 2 protein [Pseudomonadota bacterium]
MTTWGLCATILAPLHEILHFAAYHLEAGAHRLYLYLDDADRVTFQALKPHPKIRVTVCDTRYWNERPPVKHQGRQTVNATRAYKRAQDVDWLIHLDVDEFICAEQPVETKLDALPKETVLTRIRPMEQLANSKTNFKAFIPSGSDRDQIVQDLYPTFGNYLRGGFLSHLAGKVFVRTGLPDVTFRIHNAIQREEILKGCNHQPGVDLAHCHAKSWEHWRAAFEYRLQKGAYRAELASNQPRNRRGLSTHDLFKRLLTEKGDTGLRAFFDEVIADSPTLRDKLARYGLLKQRSLAIKQPISAHFPWIDQSTGF